MKKLFFVITILSLAPLAQASEYRCVNEAGEVMRVSKARNASEFALQDENSTYQCTILKSRNLKPREPSQGGGGCKQMGYPMQCW